MIPWVWGYHFNEELLKNIYLIYAYQWKKRRPFKYIHYKSDIYSGSPYPRLNIASFDVIPRFIFVHGGFKLMFLNDCSFFFFSSLYCGHWGLMAGGWKWDWGGEVGKKAWFDWEISVSMWLFESQGPYPPTPSVFLQFVPKIYNFLEKITELCTKMDHNTFAHFHRCKAFGAARPFC